MSNLFSDKRKLFGTILGLILFSLTIISITYAYYSWKSENTNVAFSFDDNIFYCEHGNANNTNFNTPFGYSAVKTTSNGVEFVTLVHN